MAQRAPRLPSLRRLNALGVAHEVVAFDAATTSATGVALEAGVDPAHVFKTLVVVEPTPGSKPLLAVIPSTGVLNLKQLAREVGVRKLSMASHNEAERLTGLKVGGISALALIDRRWSVFLDESAAALDVFLVSAGARGFDVRIAPLDFIAVTGARLCPLTP